MVGLDGVGSSWDLLSSRVQQIPRVVWLSSGEVSLMERWNGAGSSMGGCAGSEPSLYACLQGRRRRKVFKADTVVIVQEMKNGWVLEK